MRGQVQLIERLCSIHLHEDLQVLLHHVELLSQRDEADTVVKVAVNGNVLLVHDLHPLIAAKQLNALEAVLDRVLPEREDDDGEQDCQNVYLSLPTFQDFFLCYELFRLAIALCRGYSGVSLATFCVTLYSKDPFVRAGLISLIVIRFCDNWDDFRI